MGSMKTEQESLGADNAVTLRGRVSGEPQQRDLPSGDQIVTFRLVVDRPEPVGRQTRRPGAPRVDTLDLVCWPARLRRRAGSLGDRDVVVVHGALRRRFWRAGPTVQSRVEIEVDQLRVVARSPTGDAAPA